jgi:hypothetical protein
MKVTVGKLTAAVGDVPAAFELSAEAGWNQTEDDWRLLLALRRKAARNRDGRPGPTTTTLVITSAGWPGRDGVSKAGIPATRVGSETAYKGERTQITLGWKP